MATGVLSFLFAWFSTEIRRRLYGGSTSMVVLEDDSEGGRASSGDLKGFI